MVWRALWLNRTVLLRDPANHPAALVPDGHALQDTLAALGSVACVPLQRHSVLPMGEPHELCGGRCILGDVALLVPRPAPRRSAGPPNATIASVTAWAAI